jgi:hypothetical protein
MADNMRRVLGKLGDKPFTKPIRLEDARKFHRVSDFLWVTGTGFSGFPGEAAGELRRFHGVSAGAGRLSHQVMGDFRDFGLVLRCTHQRFQEEALELERAIGGSPVDVSRNGAEILLAGLTLEDDPLLVRFSSMNDFLPEVHRGGAQVVFSRLSSRANPQLDLELEAYLENALDQLKGVEPERIADRAWSILPPIMAAISRARPDEVSASGDLLTISPGGSLWMLF